MAADPFLQDTARSGGAHPSDVDDGIPLGELLAPVARRWMWLPVAAIVGAAAGYAASYLVTPVFTSSTTFLPPQSQQSSAAAALSSLGSIGPLAGLAGSVRTPADQYVAFMQANKVSDNLIAKFKLQDVYGVSRRHEARIKLAKNVRLGVGKKDGLITVEVDATDPQLAAAIANQYVDELRHMTSTLAVTEAQQRRAFFEKHLESTKDKLIAAQVALQGSGFNQGALRAEPRAAAESYARVKAELTSAEIKLQMLRSSLADGTPEVRKQLGVVSALRGQLANAEQTAEPDRADGPGYIGRYREFKYQETLFDVFARQYELARVDESREGSLIQVIDVAAPAEERSRPRRSQFALGGAASLLMILVVSLIVSGMRRRQPAPGTAAGRA